MASSVPKSSIETLFPLWRTTRRCLGVTLEEGRHTYWLIPGQGRFRDMDEIAYVDSGDESNDEDFATRVCRQLVMLNRI